MNNSSLLLRALALPALAVTLASCSDLVHSSAEAEAPRLATSTGATLIECPSSVARSASAVIGPTGGELVLDGHRMRVPLGAVKGLHNFTLTVPVSNYMEVSLRADGKEHFQFEKPVAVSIDYSRCTRTNIDKDQLRVFYVDEVADTILADMGGVDDKTARVVTTSTDHLSGYAIGTP